MFLNTTFMVRLPVGGSTVPNTPVTLIVFPVTTMPCVATQYSAVVSSGVIVISVPVMGRIML